MPAEISGAGIANFHAAHAPLLARLHAAAEAARWGVTQVEFAAALYRSAAHRFADPPPGGEALNAYLSTLHLTDLALVCALRKGSEPAWEEFVACYRPVLYAAARAIAGTAGEARARELADSLYAELYGLDSAGGERKRPLLDYFHGRSKLATWLRAVLAQRHVDSLRAGQHTESLEEKPALLERQSRSEAQDPDRARLLPRLRQAVSGALTLLPPGDRLLLSLYYLQEMTLAQVARLRGVHEATISRQLERARRELREAVEHTLVSGSAGQDGHPAQPGLSPAEVQLCFAYALEDWSFDLDSELSRNVHKGREVE